MEFRTELPDEIVGWVSDAARRFNVTHSEIVHRALLNYLGQIDDIRTAFEQHQKAGETKTAERPADRGRLKAECPYAECPFGDHCPGEACTL